jgi:hypothetical protein
MIHKAKKLDKRFNGGDRFKYMVDVSVSRASDGMWADRIHKIEEYVNIRIWAWQTWGESCEISSYMTLRKDYVWSWDSAHDNMRVYLKSDKELAWFQLKWSV